MADKKKKDVFSGVAGMESGKWFVCPGLQILRGRKAGKNVHFK
jgi:hypothetical protein